MSRKVIAGIVMIIILAAAGFWVYRLMKPKQPRTLVISHWGFAWDEIEEIVIKPFEEKYNVEVILVSGRTAERFSKLEAGAEPVPDIIFLPDYYTYQAVQKGLLEKIDKGKLSNYDKLHPAFKDLPDVGDYGVPHTVQDLSLVYRSDIISPPITGFKDLAREDLQGYIIIPSITATSGPMTLVMCAISNGGSIDNVEPGFQFLEQIRDGIVTFYTRSAEPLSLFERGEAYVATALRYQWGAFRKLNLSVEFVIPEEGSIYVVNMMSIVKGSKNKDLAYKLMDFWISTEVQRALAEAMVDAPVNKEVVLSSDHPFYIEPIFENPIYLKPSILAEKLPEWSDEWKSRIEVG